MFLKKHKDAKLAAEKEKNSFDHLLSVAEKLPVNALPDLIRAIGRPVQSDYLLAVAEEGTDARQHLTPEAFFFEKLMLVKSYEVMKKNELKGVDYPLSLACDMVLPWPWSLPRFIDNVSSIGTQKGTPWKQDNGNHYVELWLPWRIGFVQGGNHSISAGILAGEGTLIPEHVYDMSYLFDLIRSDGLYWYIEGNKTETVKSGRTAAIFEIGRLINNSFV